MAYIYKIINDINQKVYIGKTEFSIEKRFREHCKDAFRERNEKRPLYSAMRKYGIEHFHIDLIEETNKPEEREIYWIEQYGSFKYGYNATMGGDGKHYCDYDLIYNLFNEGKTIAEIGQILHYDVGTCSKALSNKGITKEMREQRRIQSCIKGVIQLDKDTNEILNIFHQLQKLIALLINNIRGIQHLYAKEKEKQHMVLNGNILPTKIFISQSVYFFLDKIY